MIHVNGSWSYQEAKCGLAMDFLCKPIYVFPLSYTHVGPYHLQMELLPLQVRLQPQLPIYKAIQKVYNPTCNPSLVRGHLVSSSR